MRCAAFSTTCLALGVLQESPLRSSKLKARKVARTDPAPKEAGQPAAPPVERTTPVYRGRRYETGSGKDLPKDLREQASSSSSAPRDRAKAVEPSEPIPFGGRSKDRRDYSPRLCSWQALPSVLTALSSSCSGTRSVGQARTFRRRPSQWTTMTRVAALLRAPQRRFTRLAHGSATFVSRSTGQPWRTARPLTRMGESVRGTADPRGADADVAARRDQRHPIRSPFAKSRQSWKTS